MKRYKILSIIAMFAVLSLLLSVAASAQPDVTSNQIITVDEKTENTLIQSVELDLPAKSAILIEATTGQVLYEENADEQIPPASITKIMTLLLVMEAMESGKFDMDTMVTCSAHASSMGGSQIWLEPGEEMSVHDLLKATAISSANDATVCLC